MVSTPWNILVKHGNLSQVGVNHLEYFNRTWIEGIFSKDFSPIKDTFLGKGTCDMMNFSQASSPLMFHPAMRRATAKALRKFSVTTVPRENSKDFDVNSLQFGPCHQVGPCHQLVGMTMMQWNARNSLPGPSISGAKYFPYRVSIHHLLGFNWHLDWKVLVYRHSEVDLQIQF